MPEPVPPTENGHPPYERPPFRVPPVPLVTGNVTTNARGAVVRIATVTLTVTAEDGTTHNIDLVNLHGGWWPPDAPPVQGPAGPNPRP